MMRKSFIIIALLMFILMFSIQCTKETQPETTPSHKRNVVIELFTYAGCPNCPFAEQSMDSLFGIYGDSLVVIEYHATLAGDTLSPCITFVKNREDLYNISGYPTAIFDAVESHTGGTGNLFNTYLNIIKDRFSKKSDLEIQNLEANFVDDSSISFNLSIASEKDVSGNIFVVLTEDSVVFKDSLYYFVAKQVYPNENGMNFLVSQDDTFRTNGSILLSWQPIGDVWLNIFIQDMSSNTIYQGGSIHIGKAPANLYQFEFTVSPDTFQTVAAGTTATFDFYLRNTGTVSDSYLIVASQVDTVPGWQWLMCSGGVCHMPAPTVMDTLSIAPEVLDTFYIKVITDATSGIEKINVKATSFGDTTVTEAINIYTEVP
jgi:hypothetical protein